MTLTPHVGIDFFIFYNSINTHRKSFTSLWLWNKIWIFLTLEICFKISSKNVFTKYFSRFPQKNYKTLTELFFRFRMFLERFRHSWWIFILRAFFLLIWHFPSLCWLYLVDPLYSHRPLNSYTLNSYSRPFWNLQYENHT